MSDRFGPGEVWEMSSDDVVSAVYLLLRKLPMQELGRRFGVSHHTWEVVVLYADGVTESKAGVFARRQLDGVNFYPADCEHGFDMYDNCYQRLA